MAARTGICRSAHEILRRPSGARERSFTSWRFVVAIGSFRCLSGDEQALVLALLPVECGELGAGEPGLDRGLEGRVALEPDDEGELAEADAEATAQLRQRAK